jgi:hypothetical protein
MKKLSAVWISFLMTGGLAAQQPRPVGAGGCASSNCHGGTSAAKEGESRIWGNEYAIWSLNDKHSKAWQVLADPRSRRMAQILGIADPQKDAKCTSCHAAGSPANAISDGVSCEGCHGPSEKWLGLHVQPNSHAQSVAAGMIDTKDLVLRAGNCLECHLGTKDKVVNHEVIAAGHPDLNFELDTFTWAQPTHHREPKPSAGNSNPRMRAWAVGQAAAFAQGMKLLASRASTSWPELSELECYQCHHDLRLDSWRIERGYPGRKPGALVPNTARTEVLRILVAQAAGGRMGATDAAINSVMGAISNRLPDGAGVARSATEAAGIGDALVAQFARQDFTQEQARAMVKALVAAIPRIAGAGVHAAEVATMSLDSLTATYSPGAQQAMAPLYDYLEHPSVYQPTEFVALFRRAAGAAN